MATGKNIDFSGRILYLTENGDTIREQIAGTDLDAPPADLMDNISTDEITPGWVCFWYDETLGRYSFVGIRNKAIEKDDLKNSDFTVMVSGKSKGCGSSRETAPYSEKAAGIKLVIAKNIEKIYGQNCQNIGLLTSTDFGLLDRIKAGESISIEEFTQGLDPISADVVRHGGLFAYNKARLAGETQAPLPTTPARAMNLAEKIIARHVVVNAAKGEIGVDAVKPGDAVFCRTDVRFTHDYVTPMAASLFFAGFGKDTKVSKPDRVFAFRDHLTFLGQVMPAKQKEQGLLKLADNLAVTQEDFCAQQGIRLYGEHEDGGSEAICHNAVLEDLGLPGELIAGTDSHTCTGGALGAFAFGVGSTDMANAWLTQDARIKVPESIRIELQGQMPAHLSAKDLMLYVMSGEYFKEGKAIGQVLEFCGEGLKDMTLDERATLTNMAVECGATTGIIPADDETWRYLKETRGDEVERYRQADLLPDPDAEYAHRMEIDLNELAPMVATPGDPRNGVPIDAIDEQISIDIAYGGSCTGGKITDMEMYARVLGKALEQGKTIKDGVQFYIQFGSQNIKQQAIKKGYVDVFEKIGAQLINPSCGACIKAGPGVSDDPNQVTVSAINRNFPGRSGPGQVYLASPLVVAASAISGYICTPEEILD
ncbi:MAG: 3-isopropylmalate dehydratase [Myxococcales bacterium]|nr:3-isopropylmalate dehydratase [Myxococcales bacterium]